METGVTLDSSYEQQSAPGITSLVRAGLAATISNWPPLLDLAAPACARLIVEPRITRTIALAYSQHKPLSFAAACMRDLVRALQHAKEIGAAIVGVVGRDGGYTAQVADACVIVPTVNADTVTPHSEAFQAVVWHLLVSHPKLKANATKWESTR